MVTLHFLNAQIIRGSVQGSIYWQIDTVWNWTRPLSILGVVIMGKFQKSKRISGTSPKDARADPLASFSTSAVLGKVKGSRLLKVIFLRFTHCSWCPVHDFGNWLPRFCASGRNTWIRWPWWCLGTKHCGRGSKSVCIYIRLCTGYCRGKDEHRAVKIVRA